MQSPFFFMLDELIEFAKQHYPGFTDLPERFVRALFETYKDTTLVQQNGAGEIQGFAVYQDWPELMNFILICGVGTRAENVKMISAWAHNFTKKIVWFDESTMELKEICRQ